MELSKIKIDANKLKQARGSRKIKDVAALVGITPQMLCNYEAGTHDPSSSVMLRLCLLYGIAITSLKEEGQIFLAA